MKTTDKANEYILVKADTNSEWDFCNFSIVRISEEWKTEQQKRLEAVKPFHDNTYFCSINFYDTSVDFYQTDEDDQPDIEKKLAGKEWVFVELDKEEQEKFWLYSFSIIDSQVQ